MKNWRTTLVGVLLAIVVAINPVLEAAAGQFETKDVIALIMAAAMAGLGYLSKDAGVSGTKK